ncbi:MAG TPA: alpha/beta hydrolase [bacterium]
MRARYPDTEGYIERGGVRVFYEAFGDGSPTVMFLPAWAIVHSRAWKAQIPFFARHYRVVTFDPRGNGRSDRPPDAAAYSSRESMQDALAVMDVTDTDRAVLIGFSAGAWLATLLAVEHPERVLGAVLAGPSSPLGPPQRPNRFNDVLDTDEGWAKNNRYFYRRHYPEFVKFFLTEMFPEPHSTKQIEDGIGWGMETDAATLVATRDAPSTMAHLADASAAVAFYHRIHCPVLVLQGDQDHMISPARGAAVADASGATFVTVKGGGHHVFARDPVKMNLLARSFIDQIRRQM